MKKLLFYGILFVTLLVISYSSTYAAHTAADLTHRYYDTRRNCGSSNMPAFLCSGVLLRSYEAKQKYHAWNPSPQSIKEGGVSFSFLRKDSKFSQLAGNFQHGLIFFSDMSPEKRKNIIEIDYLCAFPKDGATVGRVDNRCGMSDNNPLTKPCQSIGILTGKQWFDQYHNGLLAFNACGFIVADHRRPPNGTAEGFMAALEAAKLLEDTSFQYWNEIIARPWPENQGKMLPIEAFFYLTTGDQTALDSARDDQMDLYNTYKIWVPVIAITLPQNPNQDAKFRYFPGDQAIQPI